MLMGKGCLGLAAHVYFIALIHPASWFLCFYSCLWIRKSDFIPLAAVLVPSYFFVKIRNYQQLYLRMPMGFMQVLLYFVA